MKSTVPAIISILLMLSVVNCYLEAPIQEPEAQSIEITEEIVMNDFTVKPFEEFPAYYVAGFNIFGIPESAEGPGDLIKIDPVVVTTEGEQYCPFNQFFVIDGKVYFKMIMKWPDGDPVTKYCTQENGKISYLTEAKFPAVPELTRFEGMEGAQYTISISDYNGQVISICDNGEYTETLIFVDGVIALPDGLLIHAPTGRAPSRPDGLLFWPEGKRTMNHWKEAGRFWK